MTDRRTDESSGTHPFHRRRPVVRHLGAVQAAFPDPGDTGGLYAADTVGCGEAFGLVRAIDPAVEPGRSFLLPAAEVHGLDVNLLIANMDFADWADWVDEDGVFRGWQG